MDQVNYVHYVSSVLPRRKKQSLATVYTRFPEINELESDEDECQELQEEPPVRSRFTQYLAAIAANMGALVLGTVLSWPAVALPDLRLDPDFKANLTIDDESWIGSIVSLGAVAAGPVGGLCIEFIGRKGSMLILSLPLFLGWLVIHYATTIRTILLGRFITGFFAGTFAVAAPIFTAEVTDVGIRGAVGSSFDMMISMGILFIYIIGTFLHWRSQALVCSLIPLVIFTLMFFVPESPPFLVKKGRLDQAAKSLMRYRGVKTEAEVQVELAEIGVENEMEQEQNSLGFFRTLRNLLIPSIMIPVWIGFMIYMFQVLSGLDPVLVYTVDIFHMAGADLSDYTSTIIIGTMQTAAGVVAASVVDRSGRRFLLLVSEGLMILALGFLGMYFYLKRMAEGEGGGGGGGTIVKELGWLPVTALGVYVLSYSVGMGPVGYTLMGELLPLKVKGLAGCILTSAKWFMSFLVTKFFQDLILLLGEAGVFWLFGGFCMTGFIFILFFVPETKGKSLEEIHRQFRVRFKEDSINNSATLSTTITPTATATPTTISITTPQSRESEDERQPLLSNSNSSHSLKSNYSSSYSNSKSPGYSAC